MPHFRQNEGDSSILVSNLYITKNVSIDKNKSLMSYIEEKKKNKIEYM